MIRYENIKLLKTDEGKRYRRDVKYPEIPNSYNDTYIVASFGDSVDLMSYDYYGTTDLYWIIVTANNLPGDSRYVKPGTQIRIPSDTQSIINEFEFLNRI